MKRLTLILVFLFIATAVLSAQSILPDGKIPADLQINLKGYGGWGFGQFEINITSRGDWAYSSTGLTIKVDGIPITQPKYLKPHLSEKKLRALIAEFEKVRFLEFSDSFPDPNEENYGSISDAGRETISLRINGQTKEIVYDLGDFNKRSKILRELAEKIRGAGIWNYENDEIPENFEVWYQIRAGKDVREDFRINVKGEITQTIINNQPFSLRAKKIGKISKNKVKELIDEFEKVGFSAFRFSKLAKNQGCLNESVSHPEKRKHITIQINYTQMSASLDENCSPQPNTEAAKFTSAANVIEKILRNAGALK